MRKLLPVAPVSSAGRASADDGLTLVELVVAMMVFAILSLGVAYSILATLQSTHDSRGRAAAANLAAQEIDFVRSVGDVFSISTAQPRTEMVGGIPYTVTRTTKWINTGLNSTDCGAGDGVLLHQQVNVEVSWGSGDAKRTVRSDTIIAPSSKINDETLGTVVVQVTRADGSGAEGITVSVTPSATPGTAATLTEPVPVTNSSGCSYALEVKPGNYDVTIQRTGYVSGTHQAISVQRDQAVVRGAATSVLFAYDQAIAITPALDRSASPNAIIPSGLGVSYVSTAGTYLSSSPQSTVRMFPAEAGYTVMAGTVAIESGAATSCDAIDPSRWPPATGTDGVTKDGWVIPPTATARGTSTTVSVPVAVVRVTMPAGSTATVTAKSIAPVADSPTCGTTMEYSLGSFSGFRDFVLPFGTWSVTTPSGTVGVIPGSAVAPLTGGFFNDGVLTLDPRKVVVP
ncbi:prepilin-type N-terminal cleavage/methylation domain-containing protein [Labedella phragmitis]